MLKCNECHASPPITAKSEECSKGAMAAVVNLMQAPREVTVGCYFMFFITGLFNNLVTLIYLVNYWLTAFYNEISYNELVSRNASPW